MSSGLLVLTLARVSFRALSSVAVMKEPLETEETDERGVLANPWAELSLCDVFAPVWVMVAVGAPGRGV